MQTIMLYLYVLDFSLIINLNALTAVFHYHRLTKTKYSLN